MDAESGLHGPPGVAAEPAPERPDAAPALLRDGRLEGRRGRRGSLERGGEKYARPACLLNTARATRAGAAPNANGEHNFYYEIFLHSRNSSYYMNSRNSEPVRSRGGTGFGPWLQGRGVRRRSQGNGV